MSGAHSLRLDAHPQLPVGIADLGTQVDLHPHHHVMRIAAERLYVEGVPAFLQIGQEYGVVDVPECVNIPPPQADLMLEDRAHMLTVSPPRYRQRDDRADPTVAAGLTATARSGPAP